jgi:hypothetical protein
MKMAGIAWFDEQDRERVRVRVELSNNIRFGLGVLGKLNKGAAAALERCRVNGEIWLPAEARFAGSARVLLLKGLRLESISEFGNYRKFSVETAATSPTPRK